jgi:rare lipoprotein A
MAYKSLLCLAVTATLTLSFSAGLAEARNKTISNKIVSIAHARGPQSGIASVYSGGRTANGERAHPHRLTAAHRYLPFGTMVRVTNKRNGKTVVVRINDRGPFIRGRVIDLTPAGARALGFSGLAPVVLNIDG